MLSSLASKAGFAPHRQGKIMRRLSLFISAFLYSACSLASPITYKVDQRFGSQGHVEGTITTDGKSGVLQTADFLDYSLTLYLFNSSLLLTGPPTPSNFENYGNGVTATSTELYFDFSGAHGLDFEFDSPTLQASYGLSSVVFGSPSSSIYISGVGSLYDSAPASPTVFASVSTAIGVPEPSSVALFSLGFAGLAASVRRRGSKDRPDV